MNFVYVGIGGAAGSVLRYAVSLIPFSGTFPAATLAVNFIGAIIIGFLSIFAPQGLSPQTTLLLKTGLCGGFTTFSTFSLEAFTMLNQGRTVPGIGYILLSLIGCLAGILLGRFFAAAVIN